MRFNIHVHRSGSVMTKMEQLFLNEDDIPICPKCGLEFDTSSGETQFKKLGNGRAMFHESFYCELCDEIFDHEWEGNELFAYGLDSETDEPRDPIKKPINMHLILFK